VKPLFNGPASIKILGKCYYYLAFNYYPLDLEHFKDNTVISTTMAM
jgi:hypothetical protein